jgi:superfamily I DNA/RNA helicase
MTSIFDLDQAPGRVWSPQQVEIFDWFKRGSGNLAVVALAGTGKTTTIVKASQYAPERRVLLCAFNKSIATELNDRMGLAPSGRIREAKTMHSLGLGMIRNHRKVDIQTTASKTRIKMATEAWRDTYGDVGQDARWILSGAGIKAAAKLLSWAKAVTPLVKGVRSLMPMTETMVEFDQSPSVEATTHTCMVVLKSMQFLIDQAKNEDKVEIDYDDMVWLPVRMRWVKPCYDLVIVDEAQDMNSCQLLLAREACAGRICIVGDPHQAIYAFRGADSEAISRMTIELQAKTLGLTVTYRCPKAVVKWAQTFVKDFTAHESAPDGLQDECSYGKMLAEAQAGDFVLSRTNAPLMSICLKLLKQGTKAIIKGKELGERLRGLVKRLEHDGELVSTADLQERLQTWSELERARIHQTTVNPDYLETRLELLDDTLGIFEALVEAHDTPEAIKLELTRLFSDDPNSKNYVTCMSIHKSKGLEAPRVFVLQGSFTRQGPEETNLRYVSGTRSKGELHLVLDLWR